MAKITKPLDTQYDPIYKPDGTSNEDMGSPETEPMWQYSTKIVEDYKPTNYMNAADEQAPLDKVAGLEEQGRPTYTGRYDEQIQQLLNNIYNQQPFNYDFNVDPLYQQYADQYSKKGREAMMNTMGQAANLTGGYGNSYGQMVGQQQYNEYMNQVNDMIPTLYGLAKDVYETNNNLNRDKLATFNGQDEIDYNRYRDNVRDYDTDLAYYYQKYLDAQKQNNYITNMFQQLFD